MNLPSSRYLERAAETLGHDLDNLHKAGSKVAERLVEDTGKLTKRARYTLRNGAARAVAMEDKVVAEFRTRPIAYLLVALGLAFVVSLKIILDRRSENGYEE